MEKYYYAASSEDIFKTIKGNACPLCETSVFASRPCFKLHFDSKHFRYAVEYTINNKDAYILCCYKSCYVPKKNPNEARGGHYHCPFCEKVIKRKSSFVRHLLTLNGKCEKTIKQQKASAIRDLNYCMPLIHEIEKYEETYNPKPKDFSREVQDRAWKKVAIAIHEHEDICRLKWQGVKTAYQERLLKLTDDSNPKHKFDINSNSVTKNTDKQFTTSPADILSNDKCPNSNIEIDESDTAAHALYSELFDQKCFSLNDLNADDVSRTEVVESCSDVGSCSSRKRKISDEQDADDAFLCSLLPDLKRMNHRQKNRFKRNVLELIDDVLYATP